MHIHEETTLEVGFQGPASHQCHVSLKQTPGLMHSRIPPRNLQAL